MILSYVVTLNKKNKNMPKESFPKNAAQDVEALGGGDYSLQHAQENQFDHAVYTSPTSVSTEISDTTDGTVTKASLTLTEGSPLRSKVKGVIAKVDTSAGKYTAVNAKGRIAKKVKDRGFPLTPKPVISLSQRLRGADTHDSAAVTRFDEEGVRYSHEFSEANTARAQVLIGRLAAKQVARSQGVIDSQERKVA